MDNVDNKERTPAEKKDSHDDADLVFSDHNHDDIVFKIIKTYSPKILIISDRNSCLVLLHQTVGQLANNFNIKIPIL